MAKTLKELNDRVAKLPQWARDQIEILHTSLAEREQEILELKGHRPDAPIQVVDHVHGRQYGLGPYEDLDVRLGPRPFDTVRVSLQDGRLLLNAQNATLLVAPIASNHVAVDLASKYETNDPMEVTRRTLGSRALDAAQARGLDYQDLLNLVYDADVPAVKASRDKRRKA